MVRLYGPACIARIAREVDTSAGREVRRSENTSQRL